MIHGERSATVAHTIAEALCETLWPTRCALCDAPGTVLCDSCARKLEFLDLWRACQRCGAPWGYIQCCQCTPVVLDAAQHVEMCVSALRYEGGAATLVKTYKDKGETRLAAPLAQFIADALWPSWIHWADAVTFVTSTRAARRRRGFDHMRIIAEALASQTGLACIQTLAEPRAIDQRKLGRRQRRVNVAGRFQALGGLEPARLILIDDVFTTGATLSDAKRALEEAGCSVKLATVARA